MHNSSDDFDDDFLKNLLPSSFNGMGLDPWQLRDIESVIKKRNVKNIIEFGSGSSTSFLLSIAKKYKFRITSFDNSFKYAYKEGADDHNYLDLHITKTVQYKDKEYKNILEKDFKGNPVGTLLSEEMIEHDFRIKNIFYDIKDSFLEDCYDLVIIDGPNGNGRNISFHHIKNRVKKGTVIFIDDYWHYDFVETCQKMIDCKVVKLVKKENFHKLHGYAILECV